MYHDAMTNTISTNLIQDLELTGLNFDPTTPFGAWDTVAKEYENSTDVLIFNLEMVTVAYAQHHNSWNASPMPVSGDTLARFKDMHSEAPRLKSHRRPTGYSER